MVKTTNQEDDWTGKESTETTCSETGVRNMYIPYFATLVQVLEIAGCYDETRHFFRISVWWTPDDLLIQERVQNTYPTEIRFYHRK